MKLNEKKDLVQKAARSKWSGAGQWGLLAMATGTGKSKCAVDEVAELYSQMGQAKPRILLVVPTERLRDDNWREEFDKWGQGHRYRDLQRSCYASITKFELQYYDLIILDETHNLTPANSRFFEKNTIKRVLALTATPPDPKGNKTDKEKVDLFKQLRLKTDFYYPLEKALQDGLVSDFEIWVVETTLESVQKTIKGGTKANPFMQTEQERYNYLSKMIQRLAIAKSEALKWKALERMRLIYNSVAKLDVAKRLIARIEDKERLIVFCGSIEQAESLLPGTTFHSKVSGQALDDFKAKKIHRLAVVEALNEGHNVPDVDIGIIVQLNSNARDLVQRVGRLIRLREGHIAKIFIIIATGTQDEEWFKKAITEFPSSVIKYVHAKNI